MDGGGPSGANRKVFKEDLIHLSARLDRTIRRARYPPDTSQWNPIEHRVFRHVERSLSGMILESYETVREAIARPMTQTGLKGKASLLDKTSELGRTVSAQHEELKAACFQREEEEGDWNDPIDARGLSVL